MRLRFVWWVLAGSGVASAAIACGDEGGTPTVQGPLAGLRYVNIVSDTGPMDIRIIDIIGDAPSAFGATFRTGGAPGGAPGVQTSPPYQAVEAGTRHIRVFNSDSNPVVASQVLLDTTFTFEANRRYTFALHGYSRTGQTPRIQAAILVDDPPTVPAGSIAVRTWHLAPTLDPGTTTPVDAWVVARGPAALSGAPTIGGEAYNGRSAYANLPTGSYRTALTAAGTTLPVLFQANMPAGGSGVAGTTVAGTAITVLIAPRSVPGSKAPTPAASAIDSIVRLTDTAVVYPRNPAALAVNDIVRISGATEAEYNGSFVVVATGTTPLPSQKPFFRYLLSGAPTTPATGTPAFRAGTNDFSNPNVMFLIDRP